jgi:hypothetical protein
MSSAWILCGIGILFCLAGLYLFRRDVFEEDKNIIKPVLLMIAGVILIGIGTARYFKL